MLTPSRMMSLGLPLLLAYLTWSTIDSSTGMLAGMSAPPTAVQHKSRDGGAPTDVSDRDPFAPKIEDAVAAILAGPAAAIMGEDVAGGLTGGNSKKKDDDKMKLVGTAIMGRLRLALIDDVRLRQGERYKGLTVTAIAADRVILTDAWGKNTILALDVAISDEIDLKLATQDGKATAKAGVPTPAEKPPLQRGIAALTQGGSQTDILRMLGIPER